MGGEVLARDLREEGVIEDTDKKTWGGKGRGRRKSGGWEGGG